MFLFPRPFDQLFRFHRWVHLTLLFKKTLVERSAVLEVTGNVFSNVQYSHTILFLNFADDALQVTSPKAHSASRTFSWRLRLCSLEVNYYNFVVLDAES